MTPLQQLYFMERPDVVAILEATGLVPDRVAADGLSLNFQMPGPVLLTVSIMLTEEEVERIASVIHRQPAQEDEHGEQAGTKTEEDDRGHGGGAD